MIFAASTVAPGRNLSAGPSINGGPAYFHLAPRQHGPASPERGDKFLDYLAHQAGLTLSHAVGDTRD